MLVSECRRTALFKATPVRFLRRSIPAPLENESLHDWTNQYEVGGVTGTRPMEVAVGMEVVEVRKAFPRLQIVGGIDKRILACDKNAIDAELTRKIPPLVSGGGYIPCCDHSVPPDVSWENFSHYRKRVTELVREVPTMP